MPPPNQDPNPQPAPRPAAVAGGPEPPRQWLKFILVILSGFLLGVVLGMLSTSLVFYFVPAPWLEHAIRHRKERLQAHIELRNMCKAGNAGGSVGVRDVDGGGFIERYDAVENVVEICTCWPKGMGEISGWAVSCAKVQLMGYGETGGWG